MTSRDFCYWLMGYFEIAGIPTDGFGIPQEAAEKIQQHLNLVFVYELDNLVDKGNPEVKAKLDNIHSGKSDVKMRC